MNENAWTKTSVAVANNLRKCDSVLQQSHFQDVILLKVLDGFGCHIDNEKCNSAYSENSIRLLKETGYLSHLIQSYDQVN